MLRNINLIKRLIMGIFTIKTHNPTQTTIGGYTRYPLSNGEYRWYDNQGRPLSKEATIDNWILKPNGTKVHITARKANAQTARDNTQSAINSSVAFSPIRPEFRDEYKDKEETVQQSTTNTTTTKTGRIGRTSKPTVKVTPKGQAYWDSQYQNFKNKMTADQKKWLDQRGIDYSSAEQLQGYLSRINKNIDQSFVDNKWGKNSQAAWENFVNTTMKNNPLQTPVEEPILDQPDPFGYSTTNHYGDGMALKELGFNNYSGLKNYVIANQNNQFAKDLKQRFGNDVNAWNQTDVENALGVSGTYRGGYAGDFGDMARSMARWAGQTNAAYDTRKEASVAKPTFNTQEMLNNVKSLKFTAPEWKFSLNQGNIGASTLGDLLSTKPINLSQESNKQENLGNLDWIPYAQQTGYIK